MRTYFFITYPKNQYFLSHVYEQLLAFELKCQNLQWKIGTIGTGYIYVELNSKLDKIKFLELIQLPHLNKESINRSWSLVRQETLDNLKFKPAYELAHFQFKLLADIKKESTKKPSIANIKKLRDKIIQDSEQVLIVNNKYLINRKIGAVKTIFKKDLPLLIDIKEITTQVVFDTDAQNALHGYRFEIIGQTILQHLQKKYGKNITYQSVLTPNKELYLSYNLPYSSNESMIINILKAIEGKKFVGPYSIKEKLSPLVDKEFQYFDWGVVFEPEYIKKELKRGGFKFRCLENSIILD